MANKNIKLKDIVERQKEDIKAKRIGNSIFRRISVYFTYIFIKLGFSPNAITISSYFLSILGYLFLSLGTYTYLIIGLIFFFIFNIFDAFDGDVARILNKKSIEGIFFDEISHIICDIFFGIGLGYGLSKLYGSNVYLILGLIVTLAFVLEHSVNFALRSSLMKEVIDNRIQLKEPKLLTNKMDLFIHNGKSWNNQNILAKIIGIYPFKGLLYSAHYISTILIVLTIIEFVLVSFFDFPIAVYGLTIGIIPIYLLIVSVVKLIWIFIFLYKMEKKRYITNFVKLQS